MLPTYMSVISLPAGKSKRVLSTWADEQLWESITHFFTLSLFDEAEQVLVCTLALSHYWFNDTFGWLGPYFRCVIIQYRHSHWVTVNHSETRKTQIATIEWEESDLSCWKILVYDTAFGNMEITIVCYNILGFICLLPPMWIPRTWCSHASVYVIMCEGEWKRYDTKKVRTALSSCSMREGQDCSCMWEAQGFHRNWLYIKQH